MHDALADLGAKLGHRLDRLRVGVGGLDHLHKLHHLDGVEKVQTNELIGSAGGNSHVGDGKRGSVRGENAGRLDERAKLLVEVDLDVFFFNDGLIFFRLESSN